MAEDSASEGSRAQHAQLEEKINEETNRRVKRARLHWEREGEFERECLESGFASKQHQMKVAIVSRDELLAAVAIETSELRSELWRTRAALDDAVAQLASRSVAAAASREEDGVDQGELIHLTIEHMKEQIQACEDAHPKRRYYYPLGVPSLPRNLQSLSQSGLAEAIGEVKEFVKERALLKRAKNKVADEDSA